MSGTVLHALVRGREMHCVYAGKGGIMYNYQRHFNKSRLLHLRFNTGLTAQWG